MSRSLHYTFIIKNIPVYPFSNIGMPNMRSSNINDCESSVLLCIALNFEDNMLVSIVCCYLLYHIIGALFKTSNQPVCEL